MVNPVAARNNKGSSDITGDGVLLSNGIEFLTDKKGELHSRNPADIVSTSSCRPITMPDIASSALLRRGIAVIPWDLLIMGQDQLIRGHIAAESEMDAKRWRQQQQQLTVVTDDVYTDIRGAFSLALQILALKSWAS
ncbi:hypothetical protein G5I_11729 [Acromyrmex echinatior]|uniref:Uncharacterized protein n=1 Tax=Acromyrmex echinatior TaxID=103372 RepID=F4X0D7_ACREC|nr:hypothetical protein G5I_11729 [Acromyrmex echinatior]